MEITNRVFRHKVAANRLATPGSSARINQRSPHKDVEVDVKPITGSQVNLKDYIPQSYLVPATIKMMQNENFNLGNVDIGANNSYVSN